MATRPQGLPSRARRKSPASSVRPRGARSLKAGSMYRGHRSGGSMMWMSLSRTLKVRCAMSDLLERFVRRDRTSVRSEEHTSELQSLAYLVCRLLLEKKKTTCNRLQGPGPPAPAPSHPASPACSPAGTPTPATSAAPAVALAEQTARRAASPPTPHAD